MADGAAEQWPLIGRERVLDGLVEAVAANRGVVVAGPAGVGKSRVLAALVDRLGTQPDTRVIEVTGAQSATAIPLAPLLHLVDLDIEADVASQVLAELRRRARSGPVVLAVDDAHQLDEASAGLVQLAVVGGWASVVVVLRSGEPAASAITSLWKDGHLTRVDLEPLDRRQTSALATAVLGPLSHRTQDWCWSRSKGHPLFLRELILAARSRGALRTADGVAEIDADRVGALPDRLRELVGQRIGGLGSDGVRGLAHLALAQPVGAEAFARDAGRGLLAALIAADVARVDRGSLEVAHPLYAQAACEALPIDEMNDLRAEVAASLVEVAGRAADAAELLLDSGRTVDPHLLEEATREALALRQGELAVRLAAAWVRHAPSATALAQHGAAAAICENWSTADELFRQAVEEAGPEELSAIWLQWISWAFDYCPDRTAAGGLAEVASRSLPAPARHVAQAWHLRVRMFSEPMEPVFRDLETLRAEPALDGVAARMTAQDVAACGLYICRPQHALRVLEDGGALSDPDPVYRSRVLQVHNALTVWSRGFDAAHAGLLTMIELALSTRHSDVALHAQAARILFHSRRGDAAATVGRDPELDDLTSGATVTRWVSVFMAEMAWAQCQLRDQHDAATMLVELAASADELAARPLIDLVRSRLADDADRAEGFFRDALESARRAGVRVYELLALRDGLYRELAPPAELAGAIVEISRRAGPGLADIHRREAEALASGDASALMEVAQDAEAYGAIGPAWEMSAAAQHAHRDAGRLFDALRAEVAVDRLGAQLPDQVSSVVERIDPVLTAREREVAFAAGRGATNREIAEELFLSPRTVKRHLERVYARLDLRSREELAEFGHLDPSP